MVILRSQNEITDFFYDFSLIESLDAPENTTHRPGASKATVQLAKRRSNIYDVGPSLKQHRRNASFSPESKNEQDESQRWFIAGPTLERLTQH